MTLMAVFLGSVAPCVEFRHFLYTFHNSIEEFQDVVDELLILTYIASPLKGKSRKMLKTRFEAAVRENDKYRLKRVEELRTADNGFECMDDPETERNFPRGHDHVDVEEIACQDEMIHLDVHQVAFNFRRVDGILLYKHMRKWLNTDILNERLEVELFLNISLQLIVAGILAIVYMFYKHQGINCIILLVPFNIVVLVFFILRALGLCILANEYLSEETEILLLSWQEQCAQWNNPDSIFEVKGRAPAVAWIWDTKQGREQPVTFPELDTEPGGDVAQSKEIYRLLQVLSKHCQVMEDKQCIWGLPVTRHLRNRLLASLGSVFAAFLVKAPTLLGQMKRLVHDVHVD